MVLDAKQLKVFKSVVRLDAVSVVNVLAASEIAPKVSSHDNAVLKLEGRANPDRDIPIRADKPPGELHLSAALHRAEPAAAPNPFRLDPELLSAPLALNCNWHMASPIFGANMPQTVGKSSGRCAITTHSVAGFSAVPQPSHCLAASVAGAVTGHVGASSISP
jgi:hypothetical protein